MLRKILFWIGIWLGWKPKYKDPLITLQELIPMLLGVTIIMGAIQYLGLEFPPAPWYKRLWRKRFYMKVRIRRMRLAVIGW